MITAPPATMPALSVWQPWAGCIAWLAKSPENRDWPCPAKYIGTDIAIHATKDIDHNPIGLPGSAVSGEEWAGLFATRAEWDAWRFWHMGTVRHRDTENWPVKLALSAVVAVAKITSCHQFESGSFCGPEFKDTSPTTPGLCSPWARPWGWHWMLSDVRPLATPVECRGWQKIWHLTPEADALVRAQLEETARVGRAVT
jgi:hypothetical protein